MVPGRPLRRGALGFAATFSPAHAHTGPIDARPLPFADERLPASAEECVV